MSDPAPGWDLGRLEAAAAPLGRPASTAGASNEGPASPSGITAAMRGTVGSITSIAASPSTLPAPVPDPIAPVVVTSTSSRPPWPGRPW